MPKLKKTIGVALSAIAMGCSTPQWPRNDICPEARAGVTERTRRAIVMIGLKRKIDGAEGVCTGLINSDRSIITNAHCLADMEPTYLYYHSSDRNQWVDSSMNQLPPVNELVVYAEDFLDVGILGFATPVFSADQILRFGDGPNRSSVYRVLYPDMTAYFEHHVLSVRSACGKFIHELQNQAGESDMALFNMRAPGGGDSGSPIIDENGNVIAIFGGYIHITSSFPLMYGVPSTTLKKYLKK